MTDPLDERISSQSNHVTAVNPNQPQPEPNPPQSMDQDRLRAIWDDNRRWVAAVLLSHKPKWADLEDLLQDVAAAMVAHAGEVRDQAMFKSWLRTVAVNTARVAARRGALRRHEPLDSKPEPATGVSHSAVLGRESTTAQVAELAFQLPDGYREPLFLKAVQGLSYRQIAQILNLPETTIETRIARGRRMLRELAEGSLDAQPAEANAPRATDS